MTTRVWSTSRATFVWALAALALIVSSCSPGPASGTPGPASGTGPTKPSGQISIALQSDPVTLDPQMHADRQASIIELHLFDSLVNKDRKNQPVPGLAESWRSVDPTTWEFKLRKSVKFHNGEPFNAAAVKFSYERIKEPARKAPLGFYFDPVERIEAVDDFTVRIVTNAPFPLLPLNLSTRGFIVPPKYIGEVGDEQFARKPVGTGPYRYVERVKDQRLVLEANLDYWGGAPAIERVIFRTIPEASTRLNELRTGGIDVNMVMLPDQVPLLKDEPNLRVASSPILRFAYILLAAEGPLASKKVRQAMNHALPIDTYVKELYGGQAFRVPAFVNPLVFGYDESVKGYAYDPAKAKTLLAEAGFPNGFDITFHAEGRIVLAKELSQAIVQDFAKVGIKATLNYYPDPGAVTQLIRAKKHGPMLMYSWGYGNVFDADNLLYPNFRCGQLYPLICDPELDKLLDEERTTFDQNKRKQLLSSIQMKLVDEPLGISLLGANVAVGVSKRVIWEPTGDDSINVFRDVRLKS